MVTKDSTMNLLPELNIKYVGRGCKPLITMVARDILKLPPLPCRQSDSVLCRTRGSQRLWRENWSQLMVARGGRLRTESNRQPRWRPARVPTLSAVRQKPDQCWKLVLEGTNNGGQGQNRTGARSLPTRGFSVLVTPFQTCSLNNVAG